MRDVKGTLKGETETNYLDGLGVDGGSFSRSWMGAWTGSICFRTGRGRGLL